MVGYNKYIAQASNNNNEDDDEMNKHLFIHGRNSFI